MTTWRLFPSASGPAAPTAFAGPFLSGIAWKVTRSGLWLNGYWSWTPPGGDTAAQKWALWEITTTDHGITQQLVTGSVVTGAPQVPGQWNFTPLPAPLGLSAAVAYVAANGWTAVNGFPLTQNQFGAAEPFAGGITNGPLTAYSDQTGTLPIPSTVAFPQGMFSSTQGADPSAAMPATGFNSSNFHVDIEVGDVPPAGAAYRLWPGQPYPLNWEFDTGNNFTLATEFTLSAASALNRIWFYSPPAVTQLPTECGIWDVPSQTLVAATHQTTPAWLDEAGAPAAAGAGWVYAAYTGVTLGAGDYKASVFNGAAVPAVWSAQTHPYWEAPGPGQAGIANGPLAAPDNAAAAAPGQSTYHLGPAFSWPDTYAPAIGSATYWADAEVTPLAAPPPARIAAGRLAAPRPGRVTRTALRAAPALPPEFAFFVTAPPQLAWAAGPPIP